MVDKCPNCGQPSRPGARFCTSCGFRLPERPVEPEAAPLTRSPFATTSTVAASWWPTSPTSGEQQQKTGDTAAETVAAGEEVASATVEPAGGEEAHVLEGEPGVAPDVAASSETPATEESEIAPSTSEPGPIAAWPSFPSYAPASTESATSWGSPASVEPTDSSATESDDLAVAVEATAGTDDSSKKEAAPEPDDTGTVAPGIASAETPSPTDSGDTDDHDAPPTVDTVAAPERRIEGDGLTRARSLLDELQSLLPALAAPAVAAKSVDLSGIASGLAAARDNAQAQQSQLDELMAVVETAKSRPRDIDVMLDLSRHVEAIVSLKAGYDRCRDAIETAVAQLQSE